MYRITRHLKATVVAVMLTMGMTSCIYDCYNTAQFNITVKATDSDGKIVPPYAIQGQHLYFFVNDRYKDELTSDVAGYYYTSLAQGNDIKFVGVGSEDSTAFRIYPPVEGDHIHNQYVEIIDYENIPPLYYGLVNMTEGSDNLQIEMTDIRCRSCVLVYNMIHKFGTDGAYSVTYHGLRKGITYEGTACGDMVEIKRNGEIRQDESWLSRELISLPTSPDENLRFSLWHNNVQVAYAEVDDDGNPMRLEPGDEKCFIITLYDYANISVKVVPWDEIPIDFIIKPI